MNYVSKLCFRLVAHLDEGNWKDKDPILFSKKISVLDAAHIAAEAWKMVKRETIVNCFKKGFQLTNDCSVETIADNIDIPNVIPFESFQELVQAGNDDDDETAEDVNEGEDEIDESAFEPISAKKCLESLKIVRSYVQQEGRTIDKSIIFASIEMDCIRSISERQTRQKTISDYFCN